MRTYIRLTIKEREEISRLLVLGFSYRAIGERLKRNVSTISREVRRGNLNRCTYRAARAQRRAWRNFRRRKLGKRKLLHNPKLFQEVQRKLLKRWSPEQIAWWLKREYGSNPEMQVSAETIYSYLYVLPRGQLKQELLKALRQGHRRRRQRRVEGESSEEKRGKIEDMLSIEERPAEVADRSIPGHWEGDLLIGRHRQSALGTLVERTTRAVLLVPLKSRKAEEVRKSFAKKIQRLPKELRVSLTYDQGKEMAQHKLFTQDTEMKVYFAHPASPWERGTNENTNGLIRQFFPKGTDFNKVTPQEIKHVQDLLNERPRKVLNWKSPFQAMQQLLR